ncbi:MAG: ClpX C4-type zinc finger protein [Mycobacteriales bacterium]
MKLITGPGGVYICDECVALCWQIISDEAQNAARQPAPGGETEAAIAHMVAVHRSRQYEQDLTAAVRRVRDAGITWARIGAELGMTRQSAWERFSGEE